MGPDMSPRQQNYLFSSRQQKRNKTQWKMYLNEHLSDRWEIHCRNLHPLENREHHSMEVDSVAELSFRPLPKDELFLEHMIPFF